MNDSADGTPDQQDDSRSTSLDEPADPPRCTGALVVSGAPPSALYGEYLTLEASEGFGEYQWYVLRNGHEERLRASRTIEVGPLRADSTYRVRATGQVLRQTCSIEREVTVRVHPHRYSWIAGFDTVSVHGPSPDEYGPSAGQGDRSNGSNGSNGEPDPNQPTDPVNDEEPALPGVFDEVSPFVALRFASQLSAVFGVQGELRFGKTSLEDLGGLQSTEAISFRISAIYDLNSCHGPTRHCLYLTPEYGFLLAAQGDRRGDFDDQSFFGFGWRYEAGRLPGVFRRAFTEIGMGRSDHFDRNRWRFKLRSEASLVQGEKYDLVIGGSFDASRNQERDELRLFGGLRRSFGESITGLMGVSK